MVVLTRKLLRDWKSLNRHYSHFNTRENVLFCIRPQDSNLHIWHLVIYNPVTTVELYLKLYIGDEEEPSIILKCLSPNTLFPIGRSVSLTHLNYFLVEDGFLPLLQQIWRLFFNNCEQMGSSRLTFAWNRIMCKEFKIQFPELLGNLVSGDYAMVKQYYNASGVANPNDVMDDTQPILTTPTQCRSSNGETTNTIACDDFPRSQKRQRSTGEPVNFVTPGLEDEDEFPHTKKLRR
ncbi:hypothetical protein ZYGR_0AF03580 [Zygosaccharomyces rouxii]|uniref:Uncharacterized protein n=1 Tax=Zygosaccharomyces rouxii TaxID=4956 RepID=A0A1Q3A887_ZYGRO|nr:hypothetical protein ZYGR_0AF03580 [Zygosaccharomyces rouxii]